MVRLLGALAVRDSLAQIIVEGTQGLVGQDRPLDVEVRRVDHVVGHETAGRLVLLDTFVESPSCA